MSSLRVERHPRGHVASCNGRVELVDARAEHCSVSSGEAVEMAAWVEEVEREERERKRERLVSFQKNVRQRVSQRERERQRQLATTSTRALENEQRATERAVAVDGWGKTRSRPVWSQSDVGAITVSVAEPSAAALARKTLLAQKEGVAATGETPAHLDKPLHSSYSEVSPQQSRRPGAVSSGTGQCGASHTRDQPGQRRGSPGSVVRKFTAPGRLELAQKRQAGAQYLLFRRLYSGLEREQVRQRQKARQQKVKVQRLKEEKEAERRATEGEFAAMDSFSSLSTEATDDCERAREWAELLALEQRRHHLQKAREEERYIEALKSQLQDRLSRRKSPLPSLCSCGPSLWDCGPDTCANNCVFYRNPKEYVRALSALLLSLES